jgi:hypothetical protein
MEGSITTSEYYEEELFEEISNEGVEKTLLVQEENTHVEAGKELRIDLAEQVEAYLYNKFDQLWEELQYGKEEEVWREVLLRSKTDEQEEMVVTHKELLQFLKTPVRPGASTNFALVAYMSTLEHIIKHLRADTAYPKLLMQEDATWEEMYELIKDFPIPEDFRTGCYTLYREYVEHALSPEHQALVKILLRW